MQHFTAPDGTRLAFRIEGAGLPVLALAGLTRNADDFNFVAPHLSGVRLIRMDYRGRGQSDWPGPDTYSIPQEAQDALALLDHLGLDKVAVLGTSRGGMIGMTLAAMAHDRLSGLCLNDVGPVLEPEGLAGIMEYLGRRPTQQTLDAAAQVRAKSLPGFDDVPLNRWRREVAHLFTETADGLDIRYDPRLRDAVAATTDQPLPDLWPLFEACAGLPLALIRGQNSNILSVETAQEMRRRRPDMHFCDVPGRGHVPFLDEPEALATIRAWLKAMQ